MSTAGVQPVVQDSTPMLIARQLRRLIGRGDLAPGQRLNEMQLSQDFGVSRGPFREAIQRLTQEGLLVSLRNKGVFVVELTADDIRDVYLARTALERSAPALIIERGSHEAAGDKLLEIVDQMEQARAEEDLEGLVDTDIGFHVELIARTGSQRLRQMHGTLMIETRMSMTLETRIGAHLFSADDHRRIALAIRAGDAQLADQLIAEHLRDAGGHYMAKA